MMPPRASVFLFFFVSSHLFPLNTPTPFHSNACFGFDKTTGWTFFDLTSLHDNLENNEGTVLEADFYHADQLLPRSDEDLVAKASRRTWSIRHMIQ